MSTVNNYGVMRAKKAQLAEQIEFYGASSDSYKASLKLNADPASDFEITLPASAGTLLTDQDAIEVTQLDVNGGTAVTSLADADELVIYDSTAYTNKKITFANLKTEVSELPTASSGGQIMVADSAFTFAAVDASGDVTVSDTGAFSISAKPAAAGTCDASAFLQADASRNIANIEDLGCAKVECSGDCEAPVFLMGAGNTNQWRMKINASNQLVMEYSSDSGSTWQVKQEIQS